MDGVGPEARPASGQLPSEQHVGQLRDAIFRPAKERTRLSSDTVEVDAIDVEVSRTSDLHDTGSVGESRLERPGEHEVAEMVDGEVDLKTIF